MLSPPSRLLSNRYPTSIQRPLWAVFWSPRCNQVYESPTFISLMGLVLLIVFVIHIGNHGLIRFLRNSASTLLACSRRNFIHFSNSQTQTPPGKKKKEKMIKKNQQSSLPRTLRVVLGLG